MTEDNKCTMNNELADCGAVVPVIRKKIGGTIYLVKIYFNPNSKETLQDKIKRMLVDEVNRSHQSFD